jgi:nucleolar protein 14
MPPSQLKRLKASLREQGITGPQRSKKQRKKGLSTEQKIRRNAALDTIRDGLNPFEVKFLSRPPKNAIINPKAINGRLTTLGRPGVSKSLGEERVFLTSLRLLPLTILQRRNTLLLELQNRNKAGGIVDRRIGEGDPEMTAEEKALRRYTKETLKTRKGASVFNLEADDNEDLLTHRGKALDATNDDFDESDLESQSDHGDAGSPKRKHPEVDQDDAGAIEPERKKSKTEVMEEIIKKSKLHKYERQQAKEEEDVMRTELDAELTDVRAALGAFQAAIKDREMPKVIKGLAPTQNIHPDRAAIMNGTDPEADKLYDRQLREMGQAPRARPAPRTKSKDELRQETEARAKEHEESLLKRMAGVPDDEDKDQMPIENEDVDESDDDDAGEFGLSAVRHTRPEGIDDEDDFILEDGFIDQGSDAASEASEVFSSEDELLLSDAESDHGRRESVQKTDCPGTLEDVVGTLGELPYDQYHETIRQIRLQNDTSLSSDNLLRLDNFSTALVQYLAEMPARDPRPPAAVLDVVIRHIHSMAKKHAGPISLAFRNHLQKMHDEKSMNAGDLVILAAVGSIFPPSDHFHPIVTPAMILMARWLGLTNPRTPQDLNTGAYLGALCLKYQSLSKRHIPELVRFTLLALRSKHAPPLLEPHVTNVLAMADAWSASPAFIEMFSPDVLGALESLGAPARPAATRLQVHIAQARLARRTLELHHHRPLPIRTATPKFEEGFDPGKHYDPDAARAESARLRKEYKREKKGALRELRRDGNFLAREALREKRERDGAYEAKYRKIVAEIQGEEGREKNAYEREKRMRKKRK